MSSLVPAFEALATAWLSGMERACWQGGLLILGVWLACRIFSRMPPSLRFWLWWLACAKLLVALCCGPVVPVPVLGPAPPAAVVAPLRQSVSPEARVPQPVARMAPGRSLASPPSIHPGQDRVDTAPMRQVPPPQIPTPVPSIPVAAVLLLSWLVLTGFKVGVLVVQIRRTRRLRACARPATDESMGRVAASICSGLGIRRSPLLLISDRAPGPLLTGLLRPVAILPADLSGLELEMALAHELAHLKRNDLWWSLAPALTQVLFCFFPPAWIAAREAATAAEVVCDQDALRLTGQCPPAYGRFLLRLLASGEPTAAGPALAATPGYHSIQRRLQMLDQSPVHGSRRWRLGAIGFITLAAAALIPWLITARRDPVQDSRISFVLDQLSRRSRQIHSTYFDFQVRQFSPPHPDSFWQTMQVPGVDVRPPNGILGPAENRTTRSIVARMGRKHYESLFGGAHVRVGDENGCDSLTRNAGWPWEMSHSTQPISPLSPLNRMYNTNGEWISIAGPGIERGADLLLRTHPRVIGEPIDPEFGRTIIVETQDEADEPGSSGTVWTHRFWFAVKFGCLPVQEEATVSDPKQPGIKLLFTCKCGHVERINGVWMPLRTIEETLYAQGRSATPLLLSQTDVLHARINDVPESQFQLPRLLPGTLLRFKHDSTEDRYVVTAAGQWRFLHQVRYPAQPAPKRLQPRPMPYYPGVEWWFSEWESPALQQERLDRVQEIRQAWRAWALQHQDVLLRMRRAQPGDEAALEAAYTALLPTMHDPKIQALVRPESDGWAWSWQIFMGMVPGTRSRSPNELANAQAGWEQIRQDFAQYRDTELAWSPGSPEQRVIFWTSGRVTEKTPAPNHRMGVPHEVQPPYDFLGG